MDKVRHPGDKAVSFSNYVSCDGTYYIALRSDSCLCSPCYFDSLRAEGKPRWLSLSKHLVCRHCMLCCHGPSDCTCDGVVHWGPMQWYKSGDELNSWVQYFRACGENVQTVEVSRFQRDPPVLACFVPFPGTYTSGSHKIPLLSLDGHVRQNRGARDVLHVQSKKYGIKTTVWFW